MADTSKKRSRKSKLVPRDCGEYEGSKNKRMEEMTKSLLSELETEARELDSLPNPLHTVLPKLRTQLDKTYDDSDNTAADLEFSVKIEVEECDDDTDNLELCQTEDTDTQISNSQTEDSEIQISNKKKQKSKKESWPVQITEPQYRIAVEKLSKITRSLADKILEVHINNYLGRYVNETPHEMDEHEKKIQGVLHMVRSWTKVSKLRDHILSYKCYVCDIGWWHLGPFGEHIKEHGEDIKLSFQTTPNEGCVVAYLDKLDMREIPIEGRCWRCLMTWDEHVNLKRNTFPAYSCPACVFKTITCQSLFEHEGQCMRYQREYIKEAQFYESGVCTICNINCYTKERYNLHMTLTHFVRSDFPCVPMRFKKCVNCPLKYVYHAIHNCPGRPLNTTCYLCLKRFNGKFLVDLHVQNTKKNVMCRVCNAYLKSECMEVDHVIKHTKNYVLLYKCLLCTDLYFNDEGLLRQHRNTVHPEKKNSSKSLYFEELVIVPRKLVPKLPFNEEEMIAPIHPHILGPKLARVPKPRVNLIESEPARGETESAVDALRSSHLDVHGHDYLLRPYTSGEREQPLPTPTDSQQQEDNQLQQQQDEIDASIAAIAAIESITDVDIKAEPDYEYCDQSAMDIVYEDIDVKKEEFLDSLSNAFVASESIAENIDDEAFSSVIKMSKQKVTVIKQENQVSELLNHDNNVNSNDGPRTEERSHKKGQSDDCDDDFDDDIIVLNNSETDNVIELESSSSSSSDDELDDDVDVSIVKNENDIIDVSDAEMPSDDDVNKTNNDDDVNEKINENLAKASYDKIKTDVSESINENLAKTSGNVSKTDVNETLNENLAKASNDEIKTDANEKINENVAKASDDEIKTKNDDDIEKEINKILIMKTNNYIKKRINKYAIKRNQENNVKTIDDIIIKTENDSETSYDKTIDEIIIKTENDSETSNENNKRNKRKIYQCKKCRFKGVHSKYMTHKKFKCHLRNKLKEGGNDPPDIGGWPSYPCTKCNKTYNTLKGYVLHHYKEPHNAPLNTCPFTDCQKAFDQWNSIPKHVHLHIKQMFTKIYIILEKNTCITSTMDNVYQCRKCMEVVKYRKFFKHWEGHLEEVKREVKVECTIERTHELDGGLLDNMELSQDKLTQLLELLRLPAPAKTHSHVCFLCSRDFSRGPYLKRHFVEHLLRDAIWRRVRFETENIACQLCREEFNNNLNYKQHMRNHASLPVYRCELCSRGFSDSSNFAKHKKVHNMAEAICDVCGAKFAKRVSLVKHMKVHATDPLRCEACNKTFYTATLFRKHCRSAHSEGRALFSCYVCLQKFSKTKDRLDHLWTVHQIRSIKMDCPICNRSFRKFLDLKYHLQFKHNAKLTLNSKQFTNSTDDVRRRSLVDLGYKKNGVRRGEDVEVDGEVKPKAEKIYKSRNNKSSGEMREQSTETENQSDFCIKNAE